MTIPTEELLHQLVQRLTIPDYLCWHGCGSTMQALIGPGLTLRVYLTLRLTDHRAVMVADRLDNITRYELADPELLRRLQRHLDRTIYAQPTTDRDES